MFHTSIYFTFECIAFFKMCIINNEWNFKATFFLLKKNTVIFIKINFIYWLIIDLIGLNLFIRAALREFTFKSIFYNIVCKKKLTQLKHFTISQSVRRIFKTFYFLYSIKLRFIIFIWLPATWRVKCLIAMCVHFCTYLDGLIFQCLLFCLFYFF